mgnify:CR=1 FL=1
MNNVTLLSRQQVLDLVNRRAAVIFEVLPEAHWASGHIPGAFAMPLDRIAEVAESKVGDKDAAVVVYCASITCKNSDVAARKLAELGYRSVAVYSGGKADWKDAGLELEVAR